MNNDVILELDINSTKNSLDKINDYVNNIKSDSIKIKNIVSKLNSDWESNGNDIASITNALVKEIDKAENNIVPNMNDFTNSMNESLEKYI